MPHVTVDSFALPFSGVTPISRHCSAQGARSASEHIGRQCLVLLTAYRTHGALTDSELAEVTGIPRSTINARRAELMRRGLVTAIGSTRNPVTKVRNTTWGLVAAT